MKKIVLLLSVFFTLLMNAQAESYYDDVDLNADGLNLKENLATKTINEHTNFLTYTPGVWEALKITDLNPSNNTEVLLVYGYSASGTTARSRSKDDNSGDQGDWNREHTYPKSLGNPNLGSSGPGSDSHHLRPSDVTYNSNRGNLKFADGSGNSGSVSGGWYPGDEWKGDIARMMMYMYIRYGEVRCLPTNVGVGSSANTPDAMIDLFLEWNVEDPVSDFERQRNTYHDSNQTYAQGNRNPFIDNAYLATRIWGGDAAIDSWGIYTSTDTEAPTVPTNITLSGITTTSIDASWTAAEDNVAVTKYEIFVNGVLNGDTANTSYSITNLNSNTTYSITVSAKDIANNQSEQSAAVTATTITDSNPPTVPTNITITNQAGTSFRVNWNASTDDSAVTAYEVFIDGTLNGSTGNTNYDVTGLAISTTYSVSVLAKDSANNMSAQSTTVNGTTSDGVSDVSELFFSEYVEGNSFNKALEIVNLTSNNVDLSPYTVKRQSNAVWEAPLQLIGTIAVNDVFVIINSGATNATLLQQKDQEVANTTPMTFNGDDRIGLFKDNVLIDIIGDLDGTDTFAENVTLRRNTDVKGPNTNYSEQSEWSDFFSNTVIYTDIGNFNGTLSLLDNNLLNTLKIYPNPTNGDYFNIVTTEDTTITIYNVLGKIVKIAQINEAKNNVDISDLSKGVFIIKMSTANKSATTKLIKN
jgi:endonuclease I/chitodextrinase